MLLLFLVVTRCQQPCQVELPHSEGPFRIASCSSTRGRGIPYNSRLTGHVSWDPFGVCVRKKTSWYPSEVKQVPKHWPAALSYKSWRMWFCTYVHVKFNQAVAKSLLIGSRWEHPEIHSPKLKPEGTPPQQMTVRHCTFKYTCLTFLVLSASFTSHSMKSPWSTAYVIRWLNCIYLHLHVV